ncbi:MAG: hypothetical protein AAF561_09810, partial [Planctomycetota bacterium]
MPAGTDTVDEAKEAAAERPDDQPDLHVTDEALEEVAAEGQEGLELRESEEAFARAVEVLPGGVSSPVRAFGAVGGTPVFVRCGAGCRVEDVDGNVYVDYVGS